MILGYEKERKNQRGATIEDSPSCNDIIPDVMFCDNIEERQHDKRHLMQDALAPGKPSGLYQFHQHKDVKRNNDNIHGSHHSPPPARHVIYIIIYYQVFQALYHIDEHDCLDKTRENIRSLTPEKPCHHGIEHDAHSIYKISYRIYQYHLIFLNLNI